MTPQLLPSWQRLPPYLLADPTTRAISEALLAAALSAADARENALRQLSAATATWGITRCETLLGLVPSEGLTLADRRSQVMARLRGNGTTSEATLQTIADAWRNGEISVSFDAETGTIVLTFCGQIGVPDDVEALQTAIRDAAPAHLLIRYDYRFLLISEVSAMTLAQIGSTTLNNFAGGTT